MAVRGGRIVAVEPTDEVARRDRAAIEHDLRGVVVFPGFVDCHTHPVPHLVAGWNLHAPAVERGRSNLPSGCGDHRL